MEKILFLFLHLGLPLVLMVHYILKKFKSKVDLIISTILYVSLFFFLYLWGQWPIVGSYYLRYLMMVAIVISFFFYFIKNPLIKKSNYIGRYAKIRISIIGLFSLLIIFFNIKILLTNDNYLYDAVNLSFPLKGGEFYISSGGANNLMNNHLRNYQSSQQYAIDINKLNEYRSISKHILSKRNIDHYIFSDTVYCPCNGIVQKVKNNVQDNLESNMNVNSADGTGNYVYLKCKNKYIRMLHLKNNSISVSEGMKVKVGMPLGLVGNSGFSQEPHLHIQVSIYNSDSTLIGVPIKFGGRVLSRNCVYKN